MKNKKLIYVLLPVVLIIWGLIFYRIFGDSGGADFVQTQMTTLETVDYSQYIHKDTFAIVANYRDPFLGKVVKSRRGQKPKRSIKKPTTIKKVEKTTVIKWPDIKYRGIIENKQSDKKFALINIDGNDYILNEGSEEATVNVKKISRDSVEVSYLEQSRVVYKGD